jgi:hypothetical protein
MELKKKNYHRRQRNNGTLKNENFIFQFDAVTRRKKRDFRFLFIF